RRLREAGGFEGFGAVREDLHAHNEAVTEGVDRDPLQGRLDSAYVSDRSPPKREHHLVICLPDLAQADRVAAFPTLMQPLEEVPDLIAPHQFLALDELRRRLQLGIVREDRDQRLNVAAVPEIYRAAHQFDILLRNTP